VLLLDFVSSSCHNNSIPKIYTALLTIKHIYLPCFSMFFIISFSIFFNLDPYFLVNSELITKPIILLFNNTSTVTPSHKLILLSPIFTITFFKRFLFELQLDKFSLSITLPSIANLLLKESNQELLDSHSLLNYDHYPSS